MMYTKLITSEQRKWHESKNNTRSRGRNLRIRVKTLAEKLRNTVCWEIGTEVDQFRYIPMRETGY